MSEGHAKRLKIMCAVDRLKEAMRMKTRQTKHASVRCNSTGMENLSLSEPFADLLEFYSKLFIARRIVGLLAKPCSRHTTILLNIGQLCSCRKLNQISLGV